MNAKVLHIYWLRVVFLLNLWPRDRETDFATNRNHPIEITKSCGENATGCSWFGQRPVQSGRATRLTPTNPVSMDTAHLKRRATRPPRQPKRAAWPPTAELRTTTDEIGSLETLVTSTASNEPPVRWVVAISPQHS